VLGRFDDMKKYIGCPGYIVLNLKKWTKKLNDEFIGCVAAGKVGATCTPPILIASSSTGIPNDGNQTEKELCQLDACGCKVTVKADDSVDVAKCDGRKKKRAKKGKKQKSQVCVTALTAATEVDTEPLPTECHDVWSCVEECAPGAECVEDAAECGCSSCPDDSTDPDCGDSDACLAELPPEPAAEPTDDGEIAPAPTPEPTPTPTPTPVEEQPAVPAL
jgi:hypothetical protein